MILQYVTYGCVLISVIAMIAKALRYIKAPESLRWELYPVPHEKGRAEYGGSYLEELNWWSKPRHSDMVNEFKEMFEEIVLLKGVFQNNKKVWTFSFPFHFGLYVTIGWLFLLLFGAVLEAAGVEVSPVAGTFGVIVHYLTVISGYVGLVLAGFGALGLFIWRATDADQKPYNSPIEYFNLLFFDIVIVIALVAQLTADPSFAYLRGYIHSLITYNEAAVPSTLFAVEIVIMSVLLMYIPLTRMSHFVAKYFLYHAVRWNDEPNERGSRLEKSLINMLNQKVSWAGPHIQAGKTWGEIVQETEKNE